MDFVDNVIDRSSGTIRGRAVFSNPDGVFTPGMFARVRVPGSPPYTALLVPDAAIGTEQTRKFVLTVDADNVVKLKYVTLGQVFNGQRVIKTGLQEDDRVIVNGLMRARPGRRSRRRPRRRRAGAEAGTPEVECELRPGDADLAFLHRPADLRGGGLDRVRDSRPGVVLAAAGRPIPRHRARRPST